MPLVHEDEPEAPREVPAGPDRPIADFDERRGWELGGHRSCAHWLESRTGIDLGAAREKVRTARALVGLPETSAAMARGELTFAQVRALSRVATAENEADLLELARGCTADQVEPGKLPPELGALLMRAIEAASDHIYCEQPVEELESEKAPVSGTRAERYQVVLHVDEGTLEADGESGRSELDDGTRVLRTDPTRGRARPPPTTLDGRRVPRRVGRGNWLRPASTAGNPHAGGSRPDGPSLTASPGIESGEDQPIPRPAGIVLRAELPRIAHACG